MSTKETKTQSLSYEMGVLIFQVASQRSEALKITNKYDYKGNLKSILTNLPRLDLNYLYDGYRAEGQNMGVETTEEELSAIIKKIMEED